MCALGYFLVFSASVLRQIARYLPHHTNGNASKTHPKSAHDKFKTVSKFALEVIERLVEVFDGTNGFHDGDYRFTGQR